MFFYNHSAFIDGRLDGALIADEVVEREDEFRASFSN
jgi:hypothetical protein